MIWSDKKILQEGENILSPFKIENITPNGIDLELGNRYMVNDTIFKFKSEQEFQGFYLFETKETFHLPLDVVATVFLRSTYARSGVLISPVVIDAGYNGVFTAALTIPNTIKLSPGTRVLHVLFFDSYESNGYKGKYQNSKVLTPAIKDVIIKTK